MSERVRAGEGGSARAGRPGSRSGFTLIEIMIALAIVSVVSLVLLDQRVRVVQDAQKIRDQRLAWTLAAWKMSALELDEELLAGMDKTDAGTFEDYSEDYVGYVWEYEAKREKLPTNDETDPYDLGREVFRIELRVRLEIEEAPLAILEGMFPAEALQ